MQFGKISNESLDLPQALICLKLALPVGIPLGDKRGRRTSRRTALDHFRPALGLKVLERSYIEKLPDQPLIGVGIDDKHAAPALEVRRLTFALMEAVDHLLLVDRNLLSVGAIRDLMTFVPAREALAKYADQQIP